MESIDQRLRSLPNKSKIAFSELGCFPSRTNGKTLCKSHEVDVKWLRNPDPADHETFLTQVRNFIVVGANPYILGAQGCCSEDDDGTLMEDWALITPHVNRSLEDSQRWDLLLSKKVKIAREVASALHWCQPYEYIHVNLKLENIKLTTQSQCRLDLGTEQLLYLKKVTGEELQERAIAFGVLLWELCRTDYDKSRRSYSDTRQYTPADIKAGEKPELDGIPDEIIAIIESSWDASEADVARGDFFSKQGNALLHATISSLLESEEERELWGETLENEYDPFLAKIMDYCGLIYTKRPEMLYVGPNYLTLTLRREILKKNFFAVTEKDKTMPIEAFQNLLCWVGPIHTLFENIDYICKKPYFFGMASDFGLLIQLGNMNSAIAAGKLTAQPNKTFLVRLNSGTSEPVQTYPYTISMRVETGEKHYRTFLNSSKTRLKLTMESTAASYSRNGGEALVYMVDHLVTQLCDGGELGALCPGSPFSIKSTGAPVYVYH